MKHIIPVCLALALLLALGGCGREKEPVTVSEPPTGEATAPPSQAPAAATPAGKSCGESVTWRCENGVLTVSGSGPMDDFAVLSAPWDGDGTAFSVKELVVEEGVTYLGANSFAACCNLTSVSLPGSLRAVGAFAFADCLALESIALPASLRSIDEAAFSGSALTAVTLPEGLARLGNGAFSNCGALAAVTVPDSLLTLGEDVFAGCEALDAVNVHAGAPAETQLKDAGLGDILRVVGAANTAPGWEGRDGLVSWSIRDGVLRVGGAEEIPAYAASGFHAAPWAAMAPAIRALELEEGVTSVGDYAFWNCTELQAVRFPETLVSIGDYAFGACESLSELPLPRSLRSIGKCAFSFCQSLTEITLPEGLERLGDDAFQMCTAVRSVTAYAALTDIGPGAFAFGGEEAPAVNVPAGSAAAKALSEG